MNSLTLGYYALVSQKDHVGPESFSKGWTYASYMGLITWSTIGFSWLLKLIGAMVGTRITGVMYKGFFFILKWQPVLTIACDFSIFLGYNNLFKESFTMNDQDKYEFI